MLKVTLIFGILALVPFILTHQASRRNASKLVSKRSYDCPLNFIKLGRKCYYFSEEKLPWQEAYYKCESLKSQMTVVKNQNQDNLIRTALRRVAPREYWIGGRYNWHKKQWKWARSGKLLSYDGFDPLIKYRDQEELKWGCILLDPDLFYRWGARSCLESKHFICHKKLRTANRKEKKKLTSTRKEYNKITLSHATNNDFLDKNLNSENSYRVDLNNDLGNELHNYRSKRKNSRRSKAHKTQAATHVSHSSPLSHVGQYSNGTVYEQPVIAPKEPTQTKHLEVANQNGQSQSLQAYQLYKRANRKSRIT